MIVRHQELLSRYTTFKVGGPLEALATIEHEDDLKRALAYARERALPYIPLGQGSNLLAPDEPVSALGLLMRIPGIEARTEGSATYLRAGAGVPWEDLVREAAARGLWGLENLAGIPGTVGAAPVQNIGAYGAELSQVVQVVHAYDTRTDTLVTFTPSACAFGYRESRFKHDRSLVITAVEFRLEATGAPMLSYADLARARDEGVSLATPLDVGEAVRAIRAQKFPDLSVYGTAGSFFKNPVITTDAYAALLERHPELPGFANGTEVKVSLAWILDHVLGLRGYALGAAELYERQPLVLVARAGAHARDVVALAEAVAMRVKDVTGISIEREVRMLSDALQY